MWCEKAEGQVHKEENSKAYYGNLPSRFPAHELHRGLLALRFLEDLLGLRSIDYIFRVWDIATLVNRSMNFGAFDDVLGHIVIFRSQ